MAVLLTGLLAHAAWSLLAGQRRMAEALVDRAEALETERITLTVLGAEVRAGRWGRDLDPGVDTVALRAFRGVGVVCGEGSGPGSLLLRYDGMRRPDPEKDSVLLLGADRRWRPARLVAVEPASGDGCRWEKGEAASERWSIEPPLEPGPAVRLFERGSYHVANRALRYRRGAGGRQPLTAARLGRSAAMVGHPSGPPLRIDLIFRSRDPRARPPPPRVRALWPRTGPP